jgi:NADH dehydrogenase
MTFVVVGGGPTGAELAGALGEIARDTLKRDFRAIDPTHARIVLVEALDRVLPPYPKGRSVSARRQLERLGVTVRTGTKVVGVDDRSVSLEVDGVEERLPARTVLWAAGVQASTFARVVAESSGAETDRAGRIVVGPDLTIPGHPEIFVVGDVAAQSWPGHDRPVPGVAQGAIQGGTYVANTILRRLTPGQGELRPFRYFNRGEVAIIGRLSGVTDIPWLGPFGRQGGFIAWLLWLGIHLTYLIGFSNRVVVITRWGWSFLTHGRSSRLITGQPLLPPIQEPEPPATHAAGPDREADAVSAEH